MALFEPNPSKIQALTDQIQALQAELGEVNRRLEAVTKLLREPAPPRSLKELQAWLRDNEELLEGGDYADILETHVAAILREARRVLNRRRRAYEGRIAGLKRQIERLRVQPYIDALQTQELNEETVPRVKAALKALLSDEKLREEVSKHLNNLPELLEAAKQRLIEHTILK